VELGLNRLGEGHKEIKIIVRKWLSGWEKGEKSKGGGKAGMRAGKRRK